MKKILFLILATASLTACHKAKNNPNVSFGIPYTQTAALPGVPGYNDGNIIPGGGAPMPFTPVKVAINAPQYFAQNRTASGKVISTYLNSMNVSITTPGNHYFDFLDYVELYMSTPSQPEILVAANYSIPYGIKSIDLIVTPGINLKNYINNDSVTVRLNAYVNAVPAPGAQLLLTGKFQVTANPL